MTRISDRFNDVFLLCTSPSPLSERLEALDNLKKALELGYTIDIEDMESIVKVAERVYVEMPEPTDTTEDDKYDFYKDTLLSYAH